MQDETSPAIRFVSKVSSSRFVTPAAVAVALLLRHRRGAGRLALGTVLAAAASQALKAAVVRPRPKPEAKHPLRSFPSGHVSTAMPFFFGLASMTSSATWPAYLAATAAVGAVARARLHEREHHVSDVVAGAAIGLAALGAARGVTRTSSWRRFA